MDKLSSLPNVGKVLEKNLIEIGVKTPEQLREIGSKKAFLKIRKLDPGACLSMLYGLDEILALSIVNMNGSIALTNFGYLDRIKPRIIGVIDEEGKAENKCHTFLDDIICAIAASAASRIAHSVEKI